VVIEESLPFLARGAEHSVYFDAEKGEVVKVTIPELYGTYYELIDGRINEFRCTPTGYLSRMRLLQKHFGFSQIPLGITEDGRIVSRQKFVSGDPPTQEAADLFLENAGLTPVKRNCWLWKGMDIDGFEPWVGDARADNFVQTAAGIIPIDLRMWQIIDPECLR
jgi:hypothetical protein